MSSMGSMGFYGTTGLPLPSGPNLTLGQALVVGSLMLGGVYFGLRYLTKDEQSVPGWSRRLGSSERGVYR